MTTGRSTSKMATTEMTATRRFSHLGASFAALAIVLGPALPAGAGSAFKFHGRFANRDGTPAAGELHARMGQSSSWMIVHAKGLGGSQTLSVILRGTGTDDASVASFTTDTRGRANLRFMTVPRRTTDLRLGFDPRGKHIVIIGSDADRLDVSVPGADDPPPSGGNPPPGDDPPPPPGPGTPPPDDNPPPPPASCTAVDTGDRSLEVEEGTGAVSAHFHRDSACHRGFELHAAGMARGVYELCVGGTSFGSFEVDDDDMEMEDEMELEDEPNDVSQRSYGDDLPDPLDSRLEVRDAAATPCSGTLRFSYASFPDDAGQPQPPPLPPPPPPASCSAVDTTDVSLVAETGSGKAKARFRRDAQCHREFRVEVENVATGSYELCVGGMSFGSFDVTNNGVDVAGEIELEDQMEDVGARPYPITLPDALGERIEVRRAGSTACSGTLMFSLDF